ncbi:MAG TPA: YggS family pyridoxal phosphate-dependent enzyme [Bacilli bacterium]
MELQKRLQTVENRIRSACEKAGRSRDEIKIIAVTKYVGVAETRQILAAGITNIGENRWQVAKPKWEELAPLADWHFIGQLQTNKVKDVVGKFAYIHSLDRISLADEIRKKAVALGITVSCFIQVNVSGEKTKSGLAPDELSAFAKQVGAYEGIRIVGLMTMAPHVADPEDARPVFRGLRRLRDDLNRSGVLPYEANELSMGMSNDYAIAVEEGATWLRLGSVLVRG